MYLDDFDLKGLMFWYHGVLEIEKEIESSSQTGNK